MRKSARKTIELFRLRFHSEDLLGKDVRDMFSEIIENDLHSSHKSLRTVWRVGKIIPIGKKRGKWCIEFGRVLSRQEEHYDDSRHEFTAGSDQPAKHTYIYINCDKQLIGIMRNHELDSNTERVAKIFIKILNKKKLNVSIGRIHDQGDFIRQIHDADTIRSFSVVYGLPNDSLDVDNLYSAVGEVTKQAKSQETTVTTKSSTGIKNRETLKDLAQSANYRGFKASARIRKSAGDKIESIKGDKTPASVNFKLEEMKNPSQVLKELEKADSRLTKLKRGKSHRSPPLSK